MLAIHWPYVQFSLLASSFLGWFLVLVFFFWLVGLFSFFFPQFILNRFWRKSIWLYSCPCISSHSQTCSLPSDIGKNKWPTYRNTWYTPYTLQQHKLGKKSRVFTGKAPHKGKHGGIWDKLAGFKAGKSVAARLTGIDCHFSWLPPWQRSSPQRG